MIDSLKYVKMLTLELVRIVRTHSKLFLILHQTFPIADQLRPIICQDHFWKLEIKFQKAQFVRNRLFIHKQRIKVPGHLIQIFLRFLLKIDLGVEYSVPISGLLSP